MVTVAVCSHGFIWAHQILSPDDVSDAGTQHWDLPNHALIVD